jgi:hypothetical protein
MERITGGDCGELIVASVYLPYDSDKLPPTKDMRDVTDYCHSRKKQLIIGCDANAHHSLWEALTPIPEVRHLWNIWRIQTFLIFSIKAMDLPLWCVTVRKALT